MKACVLPINFIIPSQRKNVNVNSSFLGQGIDPDNPANSKFDINRTTGEIYVLKVRKDFVAKNEQTRTFYWSSQLIRQVVGREVVKKVIS